MAQRKASVRRETGETRVSVDLVVDGTGRCQIATGIGMLDHLLAQIARHGMFDITVAGAGDLHVDQHHSVEDVAICLGRALAEAVGDRRGIARMGHAVVPLDEALALVAVDLSGRGYAVVESPFSEPQVGGLTVDLLRHFLESFALEARLNLHARILAGTNDHHKAEAIFKALAKALDQATRIDERAVGDVPSTKGTLDG